MTAAENRLTSDEDFQDEPIEAEPSAEQREMITLSALDSQRIAEAIVNPPEPTSALVEAVRRYRELVLG